MSIYFYTQVASPCLKCVEVLLELVGGNIWETMSDKDVFADLNAEPTLNLKKGG